MSDTTENNGRKKITFGAGIKLPAGAIKFNVNNNNTTKNTNINDNKPSFHQEQNVQQFRKFNFENTINNQHDNEKQEIKSENTVQEEKKPVAQFRKFNFDNLTQQQKKEEVKVENNEKNIEIQNNQKFAEKKVIKKDQFRRPIFNFTEKQNNPQQQEHNNKKPFNNNENKGQNGGFNKDFGNKGKFKNFKKNEVKVKLKNNAPKNENRGMFHKTTNTGGNVDKYSINSMLKSFANNIEINTEIDDVLGNVINVRPASIETSYSMQRERKVRTSSGNNNNQVNFNTPIVREIKIYNDSIGVKNLAEQMAVSVRELLENLENEGIMVDETDTIDGDTAQLIAESFGHKIVRLADNDVENDFIENINQNRKDERPRDPIVVIMGHVDHGKTTLLDYIRNSSVAAREFGGITQHIGAYRTKVKDKYITFLDTPGHAAFTQMRMRGAKTTDVAVLVIAADDGIMPQTIEAINHAKAAGCPIVVAINKIDKPEANVDKAKQMLLNYELVPEDLGGDVMVVPISAKNGTNVDKLLEAILLQAEMLELKAFYDGSADGVVVESKLDKKRGALMTVIVKNGILSQGDFIVAGNQYGKIKGMFDENGKPMKTAEPSVPVEVLGLNNVAEAGEIFYAVKKESDAKDIIAFREQQAKEKAFKMKNVFSAQDAFSKIAGNADNKSVSFIIKADTQGSLEAIIGTLKEIDTKELKLNLAHTGIGPVNESDVLLATACNGIILTFNTQKSDKKVLDIAEKNGVEVKNYTIIYELFDDVKDVLSGKLKPIIKRDVLGHAEVRMIFEISKVGKICGCMVKDGIIQRGALVDVLRNGVKVTETKNTSLKHNKNDVKEVQSGQECGAGLENIDKVEVGDVLEFYTTREEKGRL